jgi:dienelactone hydrolase
MENQIPMHLRPVVYELPGMDQVVVQRDVPYVASDGTTRQCDVYLPPQRSAEAAPAIFFIHGGPFPSEVDMRQAGQYRSWGALAAAAGMVGVTFTHRYHVYEQFDQSSLDVSAAVAHIRAHATQFGLDPNRIAVWACSGGGPLLAPLLREGPDYLRCLVSFYAILAGDAAAPNSQGYSPAESLGVARRPLPMFIVRAGLDRPELNQTIDEFVRRALEHNWPIELSNYPEGRHAFDILDDTERSRSIIAHSLAFAAKHLGPQR